MIDPTALRDVFDRAASLPPEVRAAFLEQVCGGNQTLRHEVERLLAADAGRGSLFETTPGSDDSGATAPTGMRDVPHPFQLAPGTRLGPYEIAVEIGAGGMGEVYRARDTRLDRTVALKVLAKDLVEAPDARRRFEREARAAAALAHPHICRVLDVGRQDDLDYLVIEHLDGETLAARLLRGRLPLSQTLSIGIQVADALAAAHRAGIVHRDLKPANVMLTSHGAMLLDFGLARQTAAVIVEGTTAGEGPITRTGAILGTVQYMAPEQLQGFTADARTDIFALGLVLYEMVTGRRAFEGTTHASIIGNILHADPPALTSIDPLTPLAFDRVVRKCLAKDPTDRWQTASEVEARLEAVQDVDRGGSAAAGLADDQGVGSKTGSIEIERETERRSAWKRQAAWYAAAALAGVALLAGALSLYRLRSARPVTQSTAPAQRNLTYVSDGVYATFSPDGQFVAFDDRSVTVDDSRIGNLRVRPTAGGNSVAITKAGFIPDWSPNGSAIALMRSGQGLIVVSPLGGQERRVSTFGEFPMWSPDGSQILFSLNAFSSTIKLFLVVPDVPPRQILESFLEGGEWQLPTWHPDGRITIAGRHRTEGPGIYTVSAQSGQWVKTILPDDLVRQSHINPQKVYVLNWAPNAEFLYASCLTENNLINIWRLRIDPGLRVIAIERLTTGPGADWWPRISKDGKKLLFSVITGDSRLWSFPLNRLGDTAAVTAGQPLSEMDGRVNWASLSPDGRRLAYYYRPLNSDIRQSELRLYSAPFTGPPEKVSADSYVRMASAWSHRGGRLALQAAELSSTGAVVGNLLVIREPGGAERIVARCRSDTPSTACEIVPEDWTPDDTAILAASRIGDERRSRLGVWPVSAAAPMGTPRDGLVSDPEWNISQGTYSPDGKWLAFAYGGDFRDEKGIALVPASGKVTRSAWRLIAEGFENQGNPRWSPDSRFLYFTSTHGSGEMNVWRVSIASSTGRQAASPVAVTTGINVLDREYYPSMAIGADRLIVPMNSQKVTVWMLDNVDR